MFGTSAVPGAAVDSGVPDCRGEALIITSNTEKYMHLTKKADGNKLGEQTGDISARCRATARDGANQEEWLSGGIFW